MGSITKWILVFSCALAILVFQWAAILWVDAKFIHEMLLIFGTSVLFLGVMFPFFRKDTFLVRLKRSFAVAVVFVVLCHVLSNVINSNRGIRQFGYRYGNGVVSLQVLTQNETAQKLIDSFMMKLPASLSYIMLAAEDSARVFRIKKYLSGGSLYCRDLTGYDCFNDVYEYIQNNNPVTVTGLILMTAVGAFIIFEAQKRIEEHEKEVIGLELADMTVKQCLDSFTKSRMEKILTKLPYESIKSLSPELKAKLMEKKEKVEKGKSTLAYLGLFNPIVVTGPEELFLLTQLEDELRRKWGNVVMEKSYGIVSSVTASYYTKPNAVLSSSESMKLQNKLTELYKGIKKCKSLTQKESL